jgi:succinyl-CoA synthetase beta subunit
MRLLEDAAKAALAEAGLDVPAGGVAGDAQEAMRAAARLGGPGTRVVVKALVPAGRRGTTRRSPRSIRPQLVESRRSLDQRRQRNI